jgi:hypothetical protein
MQKTRVAQDGEKRKEQTEKTSIVHSIYQIWINLRFEEWFNAKSNDTTTVTRRLRLVRPFGVEFEGGASFSAPVA